MLAPFARDLHGSDIERAQCEHGPQAVFVLAALAVVLVLGAVQPGLATHARS